MRVWANPQHANKSFKHISIVYESNTSVKIYRSIADKSQRSFNTSNPLQLSVTDEGQFHMRFYSPRDLGHVTVKALIPEVSNEWMDFAYLDTIPAFGDAYVDVPMLKKPTVCKGESGRLINVQKLSVAQLKKAQFKIESPEEFWKK